jgi:general stress protein 26
MANRKPRQGSAGDRKRIFAIMRKTGTHAHLATADGRQPWVRSVSPIVDQDLSIWVATFAQSRKVKQIKANPRVCLQFVSQPGGDKGAVVIGQARIARGSTERKKAWKLAPYDLAQYFPGGPASPDYCLLRIVPGRIEWRESWTGKMKVWKGK